jgi:hypothetical protein
MASALLRALVLRVLVALLASMPLLVVVLVLLALACLALLVVPIHPLPVGVFALLLVWRVLASHCRASSCDAFRRERGI